MLNNGSSFLPYNLTDDEEKEEEEEDYKCYAKCSYSTKKREAIFSGKRKALN